MGIFSEAKNKSAPLCSVATLNEKGRRPTQQDAFAVANEDGGFFAAVADGMGGLANGLEAAQTAVDFMVNGCKDIDESLNVSAELEQLTVSVNEQVFEMFDGRSGTTLCSVLVSQDHLYWISVGDSNIFLFREDQLLALNHEHSYKMLVKRNAILDGDLSGIPELSVSDSHRLTAYIGSQELHDIDRNIYGFPLMPGVKLLLCTDGITRSIDTLTMSVILKNSPTRACEIMDDLIRHKSFARQDNYTAVVAQIMFDY